MCNARNGWIESWGQELAAPAQQGSPNCSTGQQCLQRAPGTRLHMPECAQGSVLLSLQPSEQAEKNHPEIFLWSQWITHILKAWISLVRQIVFSGFHTKGCEIAAADCLHLFSDRKWRRAVGPMIRSVQTDTGNSKQISHRSMWIERKEQNLCFSLPSKSC